MDKQTQEALKMAIECLELYNNHIYRTGNANDVINACKEALEQPAQEPVGFVVGSENYPDINIGHASITDSTLAVGTPLYAHPHQWQGLTDDEIEEIMMKPFIYFEFARAIEAKLKEKNHG